MKSHRILPLLFCLLMTACRENISSQNSYDEKTDSLESIQFPVLIEGGFKAVYRFGKMTPRGLKYFYDTVDVKDKAPIFPDSLKITFLSPLSMSGEERGNVPGIIAISVPGLWEETIFGKINDAGQLSINFINEIQLTPDGNTAVKPGTWSQVFRNDSVTVRLTADLSKTVDGEHLAGKGRLFLLRKDKLIEEQDVIVVFDKSTKGVMH